MDGKEYKVVGKMSTNWREATVARPAWDTAYWAVTDSWDGYNPSSGDRAEITRMTCPASSVQ